MGLFSTRAAIFGARRGLLFLPHTPLLYAQIDLPLCTYFARHVLRRMLEPGRLGLSADEASVDVTPRGFARLESRQSASLLQQNGWPQRGAATSAP